MKPFLLLAVLSGTAFAACLPVAGNRIVGRDLALADARFAALPATLTVGFAPAPGATRVFTAAELRRLARAYGIEVADPADICFDLPLRQIRAEDAIAAMRSALPREMQSQLADLKIVELEDVQVPAGELEFPLDGLEPPGPAAPGTQLWRGYVKYAETRKAPYWARVSASMSYPVVVASRDLPVNSPIATASLRVETRTGPLQREKPSGIAAKSIAEVVGRAPERTVKAGEAIPLAILVTPPEVRRGDPVTVDVQSGTAHLQLDAVAEGSAREGDMIELRNPSSGKTFRARLNAGSRAVVIVPEGLRL